MNFYGSVKLLLIFLRSYSETGSLRSFLAVFSELAGSSARFLACGVMSYSELDCSMID